MTVPATTVVMPAFNEIEILEESVRHVVDGLAARGDSFELIVVENGSTDGTAAIADALATDFEPVSAIHEVDADYGRALRAGLLAADGDIVVNFDVDYYDLHFLSQAIELLSSADGPSILVGSKRAPGADDTRPLPRRMITAVFSWVLRVAFGLGVSDTHGMKAMRRADVVELARRCRFGADLFDTELVLRAERAGLIVDEIPVSVVELRPARTSILARAPRAVLGLVRLRIALARERS